MSIAFFLQRIIIRSVDMTITAWLGITCSRHATGKATINFPVIIHLPMSNIYVIVE